MITEKNHKLLTSQLFVTDCTKKGLASMLLITDAINENVKLLDYWYTNYWYYKWRSYAYSLLIH